MSPSDKSDKDNRSAWAVARDEVSDAAGAHDLPRLRAALGREFQALIDEGQEQTETD